jgi:hypothetical protein
MKSILSIFILVFFLPLVAFATSSNWDSMIWDNDVWYVEGATLIQLSSFAATPSDRKVILKWSTETEINNTGFNIYRLESEDGNDIKINSPIIPSKGSSTQGASYEFIDNDVQNRKTYWYKLEDIDLNGTSTMHGPASASPRMIYGVGR